MTQPTTGHQQGRDDPGGDDLRPQAVARIDQGQDVRRRGNPEDDEGHANRRTAVKQAAGYGDDRAGTGGHEEAGHAGQGKRFQLVGFLSQDLEDRLLINKSHHGPGQEKGRDQAGEHVSGHVILQGQEPRNNKIHQKLHFDNLQEQNSHPRV